MTGPNESAKSPVEQRRNGMERCATCGNTVYVMPGWNEEHYKVERRGESATSMLIEYFCSGECLAEWADAE